MAEDLRYERARPNPAAFDRIREFCEAAQLMAGIAFSTDEVRAYLMAHGMAEDQWNRLRAALREVIIATSMAELQAAPKKEEQPL